jgi:aspartyl aminopeptidase
MVLIDEIARRAGQVELQRFVVRNDSSCGSTIGPMLAAKLGLRFYHSYTLLIPGLWIWEIRN